MTTSRLAFLTAEWRYLVMLNYDVDAALLEPLVPRGTELDRWNGRALASVVGFRFLRTRVLGVPVPFHRNFDEVNLRFYVRRTTRDGEVRRGVVFVRELVPRAAIAYAARAVYNEPYLAVPMRSTAPAIATDAPGRVAYEWRIGAGWNIVSATARGAPAIPSPALEAAFITEHYWGYTRQRDGGTVEYEVAHPRWRVWEAGDPELVASVPELYGSAFAAALSAPPCSAYIAEGSAVTVFRPMRIA
ncbi:MAG: YqjF family protein [Gemmatimonadaceae bacterium]